MEKVKIKKEVIEFIENSGDCSSSGMMSLYIILFGLKKQKNRSI